MVLQDGGYPNTNQLRQIKEFRKWEPCKLSYIQCIKNYAYVVSFYNIRMILAIEWESKFWNGYVCQALWNITTVSCLEASC